LTCAGKAKNPAVTGAREFTEGLPAVIESVFTEFGIEKPEKARYHRRMT
jgi:hypothetical protein